MISDFELVRLGDRVRCTCSCKSEGEVLLILRTGVLIRTKYEGDVEVPDTFVEIVESASTSDEELWE